MEQKKPNDVGDVAQVKRRKSKKHLAREQEIAEFKALMDTYGGRAFMWRLLAECQVENFGYCGENNYLNNLEGKRSIGGWVKQEIFTCCPKAYILMINEAVSRDTTAEKDQVNG